MDEADDIPLSKNTKILFNLIEIRLFDLSQVLQVGGHKLSINQIKQALQKQYNIFGQVQKIFDQLKINKLYDLIKQVSQNYVSIASILIDQKSSKTNVKQNNAENEEKSQELVSLPKFEKIDKSFQKPKNLLQQSNRKRSMMRTQQSVKSVQQINKTIQTLKTQQLHLRHKLGGIYLFNENYKRGVETLQQKHEAWQQKKRKKYGQKQLILQLISKQISDQADVQKLYDNDEISKFIREGKVKHELYTHIEYQKDLESISSFLKQSQDDAMKFLLETKKNKQDIESKDNEDEIVVNYHQLVEMLVQRKKTQYKAVENKIKQIVETFKLKLQNMDHQLLLKEARIRQLQYKLKARQGQQVACQTIGLRNRFAKNSPDAIQQLQEQHKAVVQLLKKNLDENQKQILLLEADVRINQEKIKKKQQQINDLSIQLQKLKKQLKQQKQKINNMRLNDSNINNIFENQTQNPIDTIIESPETQQNQQIQISQGKASSRKRRKPKHSLFGGHLSNISPPSKLIKTTVEQNQMIEYNNSLPQQYEQNQNERQLIGNDQTFNNRSFYDKKKSYKNDKIDQYQPQKNIIEDKLTYSNNQNRMNQQYQSHQSRKRSPKQKNLTRQSSKQSTKYFQTSKEQRAANNKSSKNTSRFVQSKKQSNDQVVAKGHTGKQIKFNVEQKSQYYKPETIQVFKNFLSQKQWQNYSQNNQFQNKNEKDKISQHIISTKNEKQRLYQEIISKNYKQVLIQDEKEVSPGISELCLNNLSKIFELLFKQISIIQQYQKEQQKENLLKVVKKYNQKELYHRLTKLISLLNYSQQNTSDFTQFVQKQIYKQGGDIKNVSNDPFNHKKLQTSVVNSSKSTQFKDFSSKIQNNSLLRNVKAKTEIQKWEKQQLIQLYKDKQIKDLSKNILTTKLFKKIHNQIRISGKGFNITKKQFIQLCKNINFEESARKSQESSESQQIQPLNYVTIKSQKAISSHKIKSSKNILKDKSIKKELDLQKDQEGQNLKVKGTGLEGYQQENKRKQKINSFHAHQRKQSQSMKNLFKNENTQQQSDDSHLIKVQTLQKIKKLSSDHSLNQSLITNEIVQQQPNTQQFKIEKKKHIQKFWKALKDQGAKIQSLKKLQETIQSNKILLKDLIKITALISNQKTPNLSKILNQDCGQSCKKQNKIKGGCASKFCCSHHIKKYSSFLQKLSLNQQWLKKIKKQVFAMHILNIDGKQQSRTDFYKKKSQKQKSLMKMNLTANNSQTILKSIQTQSFYSSSKKNDQILINRQALKKNVMSTHFELKQRKPHFETKNKPKNVESVSFLPQLGNKSTSQLIKN